VEQQIRHVLNKELRQTRKLFWGRGRQWQLDIGQVAIALWAGSADHPTSHQPENTKSRYSEEIKYMLHDTLIINFKGCCICWTRGAHYSVHRHDKIQTSTLGRPHKNNYQVKSFVLHDASFSPVEGQHL
jgi:hypothetical protein